MRKSVLAVLLLTAVIQVGCVVPIWSSSPDRRVQQLIFTSENYRQVTEIWERIWFLDMPDVATPYRVHGGVI